MDWTTEAPMRTGSPIHFTLPSNGRSRSRMKHMDQNVVKESLFFFGSASPPCVIRDLAPLREAEPTFFARHEQDTAFWCVWD